MAIQTSMIPVFLHVYVVLISRRVGLRGIVETMVSKTNFTSEDTTEEGTS